MLKNKKKKTGFTLIELVIVLAVLAIIALIAIPNFNKVRTDSAIKADLSTCDTIARAAEMAITDEYFESTAAAAANSVLDITFDVNGKLVPITTAMLTAADLKENTIAGVLGSVKFTESLEKVSKPQDQTKTKYVLTIDANDNIVSVKPAA